MKARWFVVTIVVAALLAIGIGFAFAGGSPNGAARADCAQTHATPAMRQMHAQMPADAQARCDTMHAQMGTMMDGSVMGTMMHGATRNS